MPNLQDALARIEAHEKELGSLEWTIAFKEGTAADPSKPEKATLSPSQHQGHVTLDLVTGRYRVDLESVIRWIQGPSDFLALRQSWSYDGLELRDLISMKPGKILPDATEDRGRGRIVRQGNQKSEFPHFTGAAGIDSMPPNFQGKRLSQFLREGMKPERPLSMEKHGDLWRFTAFDPLMDSNVLIDYDPKAGMVLEATWQNGTPERPWRRYTVTTQEISPGRSMPHIIRSVNTLDGNFTQLTYSSVKLNAPYAPGRFLLQFPFGSNVTDFLRKSAYTTGETSPDSPESIQRFMNENGLTDAPAEPDK
ncbi:hypothetical protein [Singulisphaera sp. PoT]|uniref:hypothetical protein n=1 Tax=Singulisphaera sp. PoT TaxID=3411797 RepID=UPI003BF4F828